LNLLNNNAIILPYVVYEHIIYKSLDKFQKLIFKITQYRLKENNSYK